MNIALIGYGRMGHEIEEAAVRRGHRIGLIVDLENSSDLAGPNIVGIDAAIEFSSPDAALGNISRCLELSLPVVSGTTGWLKDYEKAVDICHRQNGSFIHSSNFSIGMNILFLLNEQLAHHLAGFGGYKAFIEEIHHTKKLDAPSGTAITLANGIVANNPVYKRWLPEGESSEDAVPVRSVREGTVPGTHIITWDSEVDAISLKHEAKNRKGLALGSVIAAEFIYNKIGVFTMRDVMGF